MHQKLVKPTWWRQAYVGLLLGALWCAGARTATAQALPAGEPNTWAEAAARNEVVILHQEGTFSVRYRERKIDAKGDTTREIVESKQGGVARLVERNGQPITAAEDAAERQRLQDALDHPEEFSRHHRHDAATRDDVVQVVQQMPKAMLYVYTPDQPQLPGIDARQVVLDYKPDPNFHPPTMMSGLLTGLEGRVWIDEATQRITRIEGRVLRPVNFGYGIVARIYPGGTLEFEQTRAPGDHWLYSHVDEHLTVRALMVKSMPQNVQMTSSNIEVLPSLLGYQDAIRLLLAMPVATR